MAERALKVGKELNIQDRILDIATRIANKYLEVSPEDKENEFVIYLASLYVADWMRGESGGRKCIRQYRIADSGGVSENTVRKYRRKIGKTISDFIEELEKRSDL